MSKPWAQMNEREKELTREAKRRYLQTEKGKASRRAQEARYRLTPGGIATANRNNRKRVESGKAAESQMRYARRRADERDSQRLKELMT